MKNKDTVINKERNKEKAREEENERERERESLYVEVLPYF